MRITVSQLRRIIKEEAHRVMREAAVDEMDSVVTPEEFADIIMSESVRDRRRLNEDFGIVTVAVGTVLGILALEVGARVTRFFTSGRAAEAAKDLTNELDARVQSEIRAQARAARNTRLEAAVQSLADDAELAKMFDKLRVLKNTGTAAEVSTHSKQITAYVKSHMSQADEDITMDVRKALDFKALTRPR